MILILKPGKDPKLVGYLCPISLLLNTPKVFGRLIRRIVEHLQRFDVLILVQFGIPQGSVLVLLLFLVYIYDVPKLPGDDRTAYAVDRNAGYAA